jgi:hypothetical protein
MDRLGHALEFARGEFFGDKKPGYLALDVPGDKHRTRLGCGLHARRDIWRVPEHLAGRVDDHRPRLDADPRGKLRRASTGILAVNLREDALDSQRRPHRALGVVLLSRRIAEEGHQAIAEPLQHMPAEFGNGRRCSVEIRADEFAPILRADPRGQLCGSDEITEHYCDGTPLGRNLGTLGPRGLRRRRRSVRRGLNACHSGDGGKQSASIPYRNDADVSEVVCRKLRQHVQIDFVVSKLLLVLTEAETAKPLADIHGRAPYGLGVLSLSRDTLSSARYPAPTTLIKQAVSG